VGLQRYREWTRSVLSMSRQGSPNLAIRAFAYLGLVGLAIVAAAVLAGLLRVIPVSASLGLGYGGLLFIGVGVRGVYRARRLRNREPKVAVPGRDR